MDGTWAIALVNMAGDLFGMTATELKVTLKQGRVVGVDHRTVSDKQVQRMESLVLKLMGR